MYKSQNNDRAVEDELADFTDQILRGTVEGDQDLVALDPELRALQQTVLRLKKALPEDGPSETVVHRMRQNIVRQWKQREERKDASFWKRYLSLHKPSGLRWESQDRRRRKTMSVYFITAVFLLLISLPLLYDETSIQPAASGQNWTASIFIAFSSLILLAIWFFRRKR